MAGIYEKPTANTILNAEKLDDFPQDQKQDKISIPITSIQHCTRGLSQEKLEGRIGLENKK